MPGADFTGESAASFPVSAPLGAGCFETLTLRVHLSMRDMRAPLHDPADPPEEAHIGS